MDATGIQFASFKDVDAHTHRSTTLLLEQAFLRRMGLDLKGKEDHVTARYNRKAWMRRTANKTGHVDNEKRQANIMKFRMRISNRGFTMTEILVAMVISSVVMASIYSSFYSQQKSAVAQNEVAAMQQNLRSAMYFMEREIRMAGYNPWGTTGVGIQTAAVASLRFTMDLNDDGDTDNSTDEDEDIQYSLDAGTNQIIRTETTESGTTPVSIAENIDALNFVYLDENGTVTATQSRIRSVQISILAMTGRGDLGYVNTDTFQNQQGTSIPIGSDVSLRRRFLTAQIKCRNLGLE